MLNFADFPFIEVASSLKEHYILYYPIKMYCTILELNWMNHHIRNTLFYSFKVKGLDKKKIQYNLI